MYADTIAGIIFIIACLCVLPIVVAFLNTRRKMNESEARKQIVLAAIEKNKETDVEELLKKMAPKQKLLKEKLLSKLLWGCIFSVLGVEAQIQMRFTSFISVVECSLLWASPSLSITLLVRRYSLKRLRLRRRN